jgi:hypothetical protein
MGKTQDIRSWLRENAYEDVAQLIDDALVQWAHEGVNTRRNWWDILCGGKDGQPKNFGGREFPVLRAAQIRQGRPVTPNAVCRNPKEQPPGAWKTGRWSKAKKK